MKALLIFAMIVGVTISTGPEQVPTSLCHDPLLGPTMIIYSDCGGISQKPDIEARPNPKPTTEPIPNISETVEPMPIVHTSATHTPTDPTPAKPTPIVSSPAGSTSAPFISADPAPTGEPKTEKQKCNKGSGNGGEGCDPGNHPEKGNDDEDGDRGPKNSKKDKKQ